MAKLASGDPSLPEDLVFCEILTRLPAKPLLQCRAVCRSWRRRLTSDPEFLLAHHRRQPSLPLVTTWHWTTEERRIDVLNHRTGERRPVARTTGGTGGDEDLHVFASCDGLLVLCAYGRLEICNPATRQRAPLTLLHVATYIAALYPHRPSGSYRVLCFFKRTEDGHAVYHVHTVGSGELRIYWQPIRLPGSNRKGNHMLVFDTMAESFQHLLSPVEGGAYLELFEMSNGALVLYGYRGGTADLWVLQDHKSWTWCLNNRIKLPADVLSVMPVLEPVLEGDLLVLSLREESSFDCQHLHHISGTNGNLLARYEWNESLNLWRHRFRESLVRHDFFLMEGDAGGVDEKPLFDGLSAVALVRDDNSEPH